MTRKTVCVVLGCLWLSPLAAFAQQSSSWPGSQTQHPTTPTPRQGPSLAPPQETVPARPAQRPAPLAPQAPGTGHPQVMEMPTVQPPLPPTDQSAPAKTQPTPEIATVPVLAGPKPVYLGVTGDTSPACRYPAGVRISRVIEGSPAHHAGLKGEGTLSWKDAVIGVLAASPAALLVSPLLPSRSHDRWGDLILAIDGKRIHNKEEFEQEMRRFQPGDVVYFSVFRMTSGLKQIPVRLTEYPSAPAATQEASLPSATPGS